MGYIEICRFFSRRFKFLGDDEGSNELKNSLKFLKWGLNSKDIVIFGRFIFLLSSLILFILFIVFKQFIFLFVFLTVPFLLSHLITEYPKNKVFFISRENLSKASKLIVLMATRMKQDSNLEQAVDFAAANLDNNLSFELKDILSNALKGKQNLKQGLINFAGKYKNYNEDFFNSIKLIISSVSEINEKRRKVILDESIKLILSGEEKSLSNFINSLNLPTMLLLSFGTLMPLIVLSLIPLSSVFNLNFTSPLNLVIFLFFVLLAVYFFEVSILKKMPAVFSGTKIQMKKGKVNYFLLITIFLFFSIPMIYIHEYALVFGLSISIALYSFWVSDYRIQKSLKIKSLEKDSINVAYHLSGSLMAGKSPESSLNETFNFMKGSEIENILSDSIRNIKNGFTIKESFFNEANGALKNVYSDIVNVVFFLFSETARKGNIITGKILMLLYEGLNSLFDAEEKLKRNLQSSLGMMKNTVIFFAPIICGLVVTLQKIIIKSFSNFYIEGFNFTQKTSPEFLGLITGVYSILLSILIIYYISFIESNGDDAVFFYSLYKKIPINAVLFILSAILSSYILL